MRTAQEVFDDHWDAVMSGDMDRLLSDYADDALFVRPGQVAQGHAEITEFFMEIGGALDGFSVEQVSVTTAEPVVVLEWQGSNADGRSASGTDSFIIEDDKIRHQTLVFSVD